MLGFVEREIMGLTRFLAKIFMNQSVATEELLDENNAVSSEKFLKYTLFKLISEGKINEAENLLFEWINESPKPEYLSVAADFYKKLNTMSDEALESASFSREEIAEGLVAVKETYLSAAS